MAREETDNKEMTDATSLRERSAGMKYGVMVNSRGLMISNNETKRWVRVDPDHAREVWLAIGAALAKQKEKSDQQKES